MNDDIPPLQKRGEHRLVHQWSTIDDARMKCGLFRRTVLRGSQDILDGLPSTCLWCAVGKY